MKWTRRTARRFPRAAARALALAGVLAVSGIAAGTASATGGDQAPGTPSVTATLGYRCHFPSGTRQVGVTVAVSVPSTGRPGRPIRPTGARLTIALPQAAISDLARLDSTTVSAQAELSVDAADGPSGTSVLWPAASGRAARMPARGGLVLRTSGQVPSITPTLPGHVTLTAAGLSLTLTPGQANAVPGSPPAPVPAGGSNQGTTGPNPDSTPAPSSGTALRVTCELAKGQQAILATVAVTGAAARHPPRSAAVTLCPGFPKNGLKLNPRFPPPKPPHPIKPVSAPNPGCAYTDGYADARKLKGAALLQPGLTFVDLFVRVLTDFNPKVNYAQFDNAAQLNFHGLHEFPPSTATFLTFGFVPTTATIALIEHGTINIFAVGPANKGFCKPHQPCATIATVASRLSVKILPGTVRVNGVPLDVGSHCESAPFDAIVTGSDESNPPYIVTTGGPLTGMVNIPKFSHCGAGEDLDPIFNAAISGPRNFNLLTQGGVCFVLGGGTCDNKTGLPVPPTPLRKVTG
jgi:Family of unknown function (DUF6801)